MIFEIKELSFFKKKKKGPWTFTVSWVAFILFLVLIDNGKGLQGVLDLHK
jgi:hypothetical protein